MSCMSFEQIELLAAAARRRRAADTVTLLLGVVHALRAFRFGAERQDGNDLIKYIETLKGHAKHD